MPAGPPAEKPSDAERTPLGVLAWFAWALGLLIVTGLLLPRIVGFTDFSERAPFSLLGIFMMAELALVLFGVTVALQRKRIAHRFAIGISFLPVPVLAGLPPALAAKLARETVAGSGELLHRSDLDPAVLRRNVTSPGGTTAAALEVLMAPQGLQPHMERAIAAATRRSRELAG